VWLADETRNRMRSYTAIVFNCPYRLNAVIVVKWQCVCVWRAMECKSRVSLERCERKSTFPCAIVVSGNRLCSLISRLFVGRKDYYSFCTYVWVYRGSVVYKDCEGEVGANVGAHKLITKNDTGWQWFTSYVKKWDTKDYKVMGRMCFVDKQESDESLVVVCLSQK